MTDESRYDPNTVTSGTAGEQYVPTTTNLILDGICPPVAESGAVLSTASSHTPDDELRPVEKDLGVVDELAAMREALAVAEAKIEQQRFAYANGFEQGKRERNATALDTIQNLREACAEYAAVEAKLRVLADKWDDVVKKYRMDSSEESGHAKALREALGNG